MSGSRTVADPKQRASRENECVCVYAQGYWATCVIRIDPSISFTEYLTGEHMSRGIIAVNINESSRLAKFAIYKRNISHFGDTKI